MKRTSLSRKSELKRTPAMRASKIKARTKPRRGRVKLSKAAYAELRRQVAERAGECCEQCHVYAPLEGHALQVGQAHHVIPRSRGGNDELSNLLYLCGPCHQAIHDGAKPVPRKERTDA